MMTVKQLREALAEYEDDQEVAAWGHGVMEIRWVTEGEDEEGFDGEASGCVAIGVDC